MRTELKWLMVMSIAVLLFVAVVNAMILFSDLPMWAKVMMME